MGRVKILKASAGSGKTYRLAYEYVRNVIAAPWLYRNILAVTFTNKATEEMKRRIIGEINALASSDQSNYMDDLAKDLNLDPQTIRTRAAESRTKILHDYSHFTVVTIDKFFQRIIRSFIKELGIDLNFNLELQTDSLLSSAADRLIDEISVNKQLKEWVVRFIEEKIDQNQKWDIKSEITDLGREIFKERYKSLAANSRSKEELSAIVREAAGKSRAVTEKMKALAAEALGIIGGQGLSADDFAYGKGGCISYFIKMQDGIVEKYGKRVSDALDSDDKWYSKSSPRKAEIQALVPRLKPLLAELCAMYDRNIRFLNTTALLRENFRSFALLTDLARKIEELCREQNILPISETNTILGKLIGGNDTPFIYEKVGNAFSHFMIDEFQDTSLQQWENFVPLLENAVAQSDETPVLLVGDVKQSIYRWRGGDWQILGHRVGEQFRETETRHLDTNYRSAGIIVEFNNNMIERCVSADNENLNALLRAAADAEYIDDKTRDELSDMLSAAYADLRQNTKRKPEQGYVRITVPEKREEEPQKSQIIRTVEELQDRGYRPSDIAILVRYNREGKQIARLLLDYKAAHPESPYSYDLVTQEALTIGNSQTVGFIVSVLKLSANPGNSVQRAIYNKYRNISIETALPEEEETFIRKLRLLSLEEAFEEILLHYRLNLKTRDIAYIQALQEQVHLFSTSKVSDIPLFLSWWDETGTTQSINLPDKSDAITIISIHKAKGLQYETVIIPYCNWNLTPKNLSLVWAEAPSAPFDTLGQVPVKWKSMIGESFFSGEYYRELVLSHIDNINTFYVAATRAKQELYIFTSPGRNANTIGTLVNNAVKADSGQVTLGELAGMVGNDEYGIRYEFGQPGQKDAVAVQPAAPASYPSFRRAGRLRFSFSSQRYFGDEDTPVLSPRNYGIIMHKVFEQIRDHTEIAPLLQRMKINGTISEQERANVEATIRRSFENPLVRSWFSPEWETVRNEHDIVSPGESGTLRPDRVLIKGAEAVVIDYKFGTKKRKSYAVQIREYMQLLQRMGYRRVSGYIWYVEMEEIDQVS